MSESQTDWIGRTIGDRYQIEKELGHGGMSTVYLATDPNLQRKVAVKLIHKHLSSDADFVRRFEQEAALVAQLRHPNIIQVHDFNHDDELYYMVLEFVPGETLQDRLKQLSGNEGHISVDDAIRIMATLCDAVDYAHQHDMVHRDLKPANVMLNPQDQPILMDFGVARMMGGQSHTATGSIIGTAQYMSPEQARGEHPDERSDIYSLGVMLFEMVTGQRPFDGDSAVSVMLKHIAEPVPDIRRISADVPLPLISVTEKALTKEPTQRYQSASAMANALRMLTHSAEVTLRVQADSTRVRAKVEEATPSAGARSRRPLVIGAIALVAIILVGAFLLLSGGADPQVEDATLPSAEGMIRVNAGVYLVGLDASDPAYSPPQQVKLEDFWIDKYEVTNALYSEFIAETGQTTPISWSAGAFPAGEEQHPVEGITWDAASAYCEGALKRLPDEAEWEVAARGPQGQLYPWGQIEGAVELPRGGSYAVGSVAGNVSPFGAYDMAGNVWEWVDTPYAPITAGERILHGGAHGFLKDLVYRLQGDPNIPTLVATAGVRCAASDVSGGAEQVEILLSSVLPEGVVFQDEFANPNSGWPVGETGNYRFGYHPAAFYHLEVNAPDDRFSIAAPDLNLDNFSVESLVLVDHTDTDAGDFRYGLALRQTDDNFYAFTISPRSGTWQVLKRSSSGIESLDSGVIDTLRGLESADALQVDASGSSFTFRINGEIVSQVSDSDYASGDVGFFAETFDETLAHVHFASLLVRDIDVVDALYHDNFSNPLTGWPDDEQDTFRFGYHPPDFYHLELSVPSDNLLVTQALNLDNALIEADIFVDHTDTETGDFRYGLAIRVTGDQYYAFIVSSRANTWEFFKHSAAGVDVLASGGDLSLGGSESNDKLVVNADGSTFTLLINGEQVAQISDSDYSGGEIGFYLESLDETLAHVHYDTLTIREVEATAIDPAPTTPTEVPLPSVPEGMTLVAAGHFAMGSTTGQANEAPEHPVLLDAFYIDLYEVTNAQYQACVDSDACNAARNQSGFTRGSYGGDPTYDNYPVIGVTWDLAVSYCNASGKRLPSEAEWEYAASGPGNVTWPWGENFDANLSAASAPDTQAVGSYPEGVSPFGVFDMAGNVVEWVADVYDASFYDNSPASNPRNDAGGDTRIFRGGSFASANGANYTTSRRFTTSRSSSDVDTGFRCAQDAPEVNESMSVDTREALTADFCQIYLAYRPDGVCP